MLRRRVLLLAAPLLRLRADERTDAADAVAPIASGLSEGDEAGILRVIPQEQEALRANLLALIAHADVTSSIVVVSATADSAELDWYMEIRNRTSQTIVERRRGRVQIRHRQKKLLSLEPASFFAPPNAAERAYNRLSTSSA